MAKVYVVTEYHWPDFWEVAAVFDSREKAEELVPKDRPDNDAAGSGRWEVTEFELL